MRDDLRGEDDLSTDGLHEYAAARRRLAEEAGGLSYEQVRSRLQELDARQGISRSRAHLELFSRLIKDERHYRATRSAPPGGCCAMAARGPSRDAGGRCAAAWSGSPASAPAARC